MDRNWNIFPEMLNLNKFHQSRLKERKWHREQRIRGNCERRSNRQDESARRKEGEKTLLLIEEEGGRVQSACSERWRE